MTQQADDAPRNRPPGRQKGTPNKLTKEVRALAREYGPLAIRVLHELMVDEETPHATRRAAAVDLLDRGYGKPSNHISLDDATTPKVPAFIGLVGMTAQDVLDERKARKSREADPSDEQEEGDDEGWDEDGWESDD